ncbi:hypothetical protein OESDEN_10651, partial [Oesophagostomum dentatum]
MSRIHSFFREEKRRYDKTCRERERRMNPVMNASLQRSLRCSRTLPSLLRRFFSEKSALEVDSKKNGSDALKRFIVDKIRATGPITVAEYMKTVVSAPSVGYYGRYSDSQKVGAPCSSGNCSCSNLFSLKHYGSCERDIVQSFHRTLDGSGLAV